MEVSEKSLLDSIQILPEQMSQLIERYEAKIQKLINDAKIAKNEIEAKYEVRVAELMRAVEQIKETLEGEKLINEELLTELNSKCVSLEEALNLAKEELSEINSEFEKTKQDLASEKDLCLGYKAQVDSLSSTLDATILEKQTFEQELDSCRETLSQTRENVNNLLLEKKSLESQILDSGNEVSRLEAIVDDLNSQVQSLQKKNEENTESLNSLLQEHSSLKNKFEAVTGVSMRNKKIFDEHVKRSIENNQKSVDSQGQLQLDIIEKNKSIEILSGEIENLKSQIEEAKNIKRDFEKEKRRIRLEVEAEFRKKNFVSAVTHSVQEIPTQSPPKDPNREKVFEPLSASSSSPSIVESSKSKKDKKRKSMTKQYFSDDQPFCKDLVNERCNDFEVGDMLSSEALADAIANKILRKSPKHHLCYICKDISKKKCDYLAKGNKWCRDKNMSFLKECISPALIKLANKFIAEERISMVPDDNVIANLLGLISKIKNEKSYFEDLKNYLVSKISYSE